MKADHLIEASQELAKTVLFLLEELKVDELDELSTANLYMSTLMVSGHAEYVLSAYPPNKSLSPTAHRPGRRRAKS